MSHLSTLRQTTAIAVTVVLVLAGCSVSGAVESAAESFVAPDTWSFQEAETLNGFEDISHNLYYNAEESINEACAKGRQALAEWAEIPADDLSEDLSRGCSYSTQVVPRLRPESLRGSVHVRPVRVDGVSIEDRDQPAGAGEIRFTVRESK